MGKVSLFIIACVLSFACTNNGKESATALAHDHGDAMHTHGSEAINPEEILEIKTIGMTGYSPEYIQLATNVEIIPEIMNSEKTISVSTHEGNFGPLLFGENIWSFFIDLKPGMFLEEHPHPTESLVYTVRGRWVLCSEGKRYVMEAGSTFHFGSGMPTGWEAPFPEGAFLLIVKSRPDGLSYESNLDGLREVKNLLEKERKEGVPFYFFELEEDHPAVRFAREVNPDFDEVLKIKY